MKKHYWLGLVMLLGTGCGSGTEVSNPPVPTTTTLVSSTLFNASLSKSVAKTVSSDCANDLASCVTPSNVSGKVYYAGIMVGQEEGYSLGPIVGDITDPSVITSFPQADLQDFDLGSQLAVDGGIVCCGGVSYPADDQATVRSVDIYFAYADVTFSLAASDGVNSTLVGDHTVRLVFGNIDETEMQKGDLLYQGSGESDFKWCTSSAGCVHTTRPASPLQEPDIASFDGGGERGNPVIPTFTANLVNGHPEVQITENQVLNNSFAITIDFDMANGAGFASNVTQLTSIDQLVGAFRLAAKAGQSDTGFTSTVDVVLTPTETGAATSE